jgi:hypothetical protein
MVSPSSSTATPSDSTVTPTSATQTPSGTVVTPVQNTLEGIISEPRSTNVTPVQNTLEGIISEPRSTNVTPVQNTLEGTVTIIALSIDIDIKPGSDPNSINPRNKGTIPVAILTTDLFDALTVDDSSLTFGRTGDEASLAFCTTSLEDVDKDGDLDKVCHFNSEQTGFQMGDTMGTLKGQTIDSIPFIGMDSVKITKK